VTKGLRITVFICLAVLLTVIYWFFKGTIFPEDTIGVVIYTALLMLSFNTLILEHYFTKPTDVLAASIAVLLLITPIRHELNNLGNWFTVLFCFSFSLAVISVISLAFFDPQKPEDNTQNKISKLLKDFVVKFGNSKIQFFCVFVLTLFFYVDSHSEYFVVLFIYSAFILTDPWKFILKLPSFAKKEPQQGIGQIFGVQSKNTFLVKLYDERPTIKIFDFVEFRYSMEDNTKVRKGLILDNYLLNQEQWVKVLVSEEINKLFGDKVYNQFKDENIVFKISKPEENNYLEKFVGIVDENSTISTIRFIYNSKKEIFDGQLLEIFIRDKKVLYQVVQGVTKIELLEHKNETGYIVGEAFQLGIWKNDTECFEKYGWVPFINSPVYIASNIQDPAVLAGEYKIGNIPDTNYPIIINKEVAITHHTAILGVTGSGKSVFVRNLIRQIADENNRVIIIDLSGEYKQKMENIESIISDENAKASFAAIELIAKEKTKFANQWNHELIDAQEKIIKKAFYESIKHFLEGQNTKAIFELPDISNNSDILDYTKWFFWVLFKTAKAEKNFGRRVCVVIEEAHTIVPELNSMGVSDFASKATVNSIAQIALQGRKYNIGFFVIAQRTANVSKTVLTQCNSIIAFQEFDKTSSDFLSNYLGLEFIRALPNLKQRQAIAVGKAFKSNVPMIFEVPHIDEPEPVNEVAEAVAAN
jgi:hypothetical protein